MQLGREDRDKTCMPKTENNNCPISSIEKIS